VQDDVYSGDHCLALPKLNLQFLTLHDYLLRNYNLFRLEANYEIREDLEDVIKRVGPRANPEGGVAYTGAARPGATGGGRCQGALAHRPWARPRGIPCSRPPGWSRMATQVSEFSIVSVGKPELGGVTPSFVKADVSFSLARFNEGIQREWDALRPHDVLFLVSLQPEAKLASEPPPEIDADPQAFCAYYGIKAVRGCEITNVVDSEGKPADDIRAIQAAQEGCGAWGVLIERR